ncbi:MAG: metal ABC transporter substrate-binding protein [Synergistaceae bacterium]|jgi:zinc transport system substrate-binding protein|nr:metal ABC transporter substrate-binding protein [Synergistaceae bacterium]
MGKNKFALLAAALVVISASALALAALASSSDAVPGVVDGRVNVVATIFPQYDFTRAVAADRVNLSMLVRPGSEIHSFDPTPQDIISIRNADLFIYIGGESDAWVDEILESIEASDMKILRLIDCVRAVPEETVEGMQEEDGEEGEDELDEHIWTAPTNAMVFVQVIADALCDVDPGNADFYSANAERYIGDIASVDREIRDIVATAKRKKIVFGERFPFRYFTDLYGLKYSAAFPGCSTESDVSAATMAYLIRTVENEDIPVVYTLELSGGNIARAIAEQTGAEVRVLHSCHNLTKSDFELGRTYVSIMRDNAESLRMGLN